MFGVLEAIGGRLQDGVAMVLTMTLRVAEVLLPAIVTLVTPARPRPRP